MNLGSASRFLAVVNPVVTLGAYAALGARDRGGLDPASEKAAAAKDRSAKAVTLAQQAPDTSNAARGATDRKSNIAPQGAQHARAANEKADRIRWRSLRK